MEPEDFPLPASDAAEELASLAASGWRGLPVPPLTSVSAVRAYQACERAWFFDRVAGIEQKGRARGGALETGILVHAVLHALAEGRDPEAELTKHRELAIDAGLSEKERENVEAGLAVASAVGAVWPTWAAVQVPVLEVVPGGSERAFADTGESGLRGRLDRKVRAAEGPWAGLWIEDFKTHALGSGDEIIDRTPLDKQALTYVLEAGDVRGIVWSLIGKTASRRRQKESLEEYCARIKAEYAEEPGKYFRRHFEPLDGRRVLPMLAAARASHARAAVDYAVLDLGLEAWQQREANCTARGRCPFLELCRGSSTALYRRKERR